MKELIEKVARSIHDSQWDEAYDELNQNGIEKALAKQSAIAAIRSVLEHFSEPGNISDAMSVAAVVKWQNDESGGSLQDWLETAIASAMRAALSELQAKEAGE